MRSAPFSLPANRKFFLPKLCKALHKIGRKNYLFAGSHDAAQRAAMIYSLFATCTLHDINPYNWLKDVLERMHSYTMNNLHELLPQNWKPVNQ
jgi:transposase